MIKVLRAPHQSAAVTKTRFDKKTKALLLLAALCLALLLPQLVGETTYLTSYVANLAFHGNWHEVVPGRFYRSAELSTEELVGHIRAQGIKTVIDLRFGEEKPAQGKTLESEVSSASGAAYYHLPLVGSDAGQKQKISELLALYDKAQTPVLVHCTSGTHRSGVAAAIWLLTRENAGAAAAAEQLSHRYGFFYYERRLKSHLQGHQTIDAVIWKYFAAQKGGEPDFREWLAATDDQALRALN